MLNFNIIGFLVLEKNCKSYHIWAWRPSWSCDQEHVHYFLLPLPQEAPRNLALISQVVSEMFENNGYIHVYSPGAGADNSLGPFFSLKKHVNLVICCTFFPD